MASSAGGEVCAAIPPTIASLGLTKEMISPARLKPLTTVRQSAARSHRLDRHMSGQIVGRDTIERIEERGLEAARPLRQRGRH